MLKDFNDLYLNKNTVQISGWCHSGFKTGSRMNVEKIL